GGGRRSGSHGRHPSKLQGGLRSRGSRQAEGECPGRARGDGPHCPHRIEDVRGGVELTSWPPFRSSEGIARLSKMLRAGSEGSSPEACRRPHSWAASQGLLEAPSQIGQER